MKKIKLCEICGKEVDPKVDKHLNIVNKYYHWDCLGKEKVAGVSIVPTYSKDQVADMTFDEALSYMDERIEALSLKYHLPEGEIINARMILRQISEKYAAAAKSVDKTKKSA